MPKGIFAKLSCVRCKLECHLNAWSRHDRSCKILNPKKPYTVWNKGLTWQDDSRIKSYGLKLRGRQGPPLTVEQKSRLSTIARERGFGGYRPNAGHSRKYHVTDSFGVMTCLQSSFELRCSQILTLIQLRWSRPKPLRYRLEGRSRLYYPDFYLTDHNLYLDTKNEYLYRIDAAKIKAVCDEGHIIKVIREHELTVEFIGHLAHGR